MTASDLWIDQKIKAGCDWGVQFVPTAQDFWGLMCKLEFLRLDLEHGCIGNVLYVALEPPESVPGFIARVVDDVRAFCDAAL